jgi:hypothetical protein
MKKIGVRFKEAVKADWDELTTYETGEKKPV